MGTVTTSLRDEAQSIFDDLGYTVSQNGGEIRAERKWRVVQVTPMQDPDDLPTTGELRCFVTWADRTRELRRHLQEADPDYEWAIIGIRDGGDYSVIDRTA